MSKSSFGDNAALSGLKRWVDPSFSEFPRDSFSPIPGGKARKGPKADQRNARKRAGDAGCSERQTSDAQQESRTQGNWDESWVDTHAPHSQAELAVHKKKIETVEQWMRGCSNASQGCILLLSGPSGCGKTATVRVLSRELGFRILEWTNPTSEPFNSSSSSQYAGFRNNNFPVSQVVQFRDFLLRANKYNCLKMVGDGGASDHKLILVEEFPNQFYRQPGSLHDILRCFVKTSRCPVVFIVSESLSGDSSLRCLFPKDIQEELGITHISFNPVAPTTMTKVLTRISNLETKKGCGTLDQTLLDRLCSESLGDIRSAVNSLQFLLLPENRLWNTKKKRPCTTLDKTDKKSRRNQVKKSKQRKQLEEEPSISGKDGSLFLFRALGKILHCKRENNEAPQHCLPPHLSHHDRVALAVDPELTVERSKMSGEFFNLYLHQNFLDFFCEVEDVARASKYLSDADLLTTEWSTRSTMADYGSSVATRGLLHSNAQQVSVGFRPLHKPNWLLVNKNYHGNCVEAQSLFKSFCLTPVSLQTELLPYLAKLSNPMRNQAQITFIQDVGQMPLQRFSRRVHLEALKEQELVTTTMDSEGEEDNAKDGQSEAKDDLPASQPLPASNELLLDEEDLIIDVYISD